jgi:hypothetical protein
MAATIGTGIDDHGNHYLTLDGPIVAGDPERFAAEIFAANAHGYRLDALRLNSPGGSVWEAMAIAVMVRWVENIATVVQKDAKCESACFGILAAGWRMFVDPALPKSDSDPDPITQIGVHSLYQFIEQKGSPFLKESGDATIEAVRLLKYLGVPDSVIGKIVTTPSKQLRYLSISDLKSMGVKVADDPEFNQTRPFPDETTIKEGIIMLTPAVLKVGVTLKNGISIPAGTFVMARDNLPPRDPDPAICFFKNNATHLCDVTYHLPGQELSLAQIPNPSLTLIRQGWRDWFSPGQPAQQPPPLSEQPQVAPEPHFPSIAEPQPPKKLWARKYVARSGVLV